MTTDKLPNEAILPALAEIVNVIAGRYSRKQVQQLLWYMGGTLGKGYDDEEQTDAITDNCKEWLSNPDCFRDE